MSWQAYIDTLKSYGNVAAGAFHGLDGSPWASSPELKINPAEIASIVKLNESEVSEKGVKIAGEKYVFLRKEDTDFGFVVQLRKGTGGASVAKSKSLVIIGVYGENDQGGGCSDSVYKMADYLFSQGY